MAKTYVLADRFLTIQGEGINAGRAALFVRFAACNLWSGLEEDRDRDAARNHVSCPRFCDTDFRPRGRMSASEIAEVVRDASRVELVVFTGGEPLLQLDEELMSALPKGLDYAVETNGTVAFRPGVRERVTHVCVSPKVGPDRLVIREGTELKVVMPSYDPLAYEEAIVDGRLRFEHTFVQPEAELDGISETNVREAVAFVLGHPRWRLSYQLHKTIGVP